MSANIRKFFIGNIPWTVSRSELMQYFKKFGPVSNCHIVFDEKTGISKGFGFVTFTNKAAVDNVQNKLDHSIDNVTLQVQSAQENFTARS